MGYPSLVTLHVLRSDRKMRCRKLKRISSKYMDGRLSKRRARLAEEHIRDCPDCAAEAKSLERMRSLLRTAGKIELPDTYWDTYWDRLEEKLPDEPSPVSLTPRISRAIAASLRRPAVLGRIAVYVILLAFLIYTTPHLPPRMRGSEVGPRVPMLARARSEIADTGGVFDASFRELNKVKKGTEAEEEAALSRRRFAGGRASLAMPKGEASDRPVEYAAEKDGLGSKLAEAKEQPAITERVVARAEPAKPAAAQLTPLGMAKDRPDVAEVADSEDEYVAAENYFKKGEYRQAITAYQNFIIANVHDDRTLRAAYQIGEANFQIGNYSDALSNFVAVTDFASDKTTDAETSEAFALKVAGYQYDDGAARDGAARETGAKAERPETSRGAAALKRVPQRSRDREPRVSMETREELISRAIFRQAESYEHLGKREEALAAYKKYVERYPQGKSLSKAKEKIAQLVR
jgi:TolA-binding protein